MNDETLISFRWLFSDGSNSSDSDDSDDTDSEIEEIAFFAPADVVDQQDRRTLYYTILILCISFDHVYDLFHYYVKQRRCPTP